jgi:hypothetical protein
MGDLWTFSRNRPEIFYICWITTVRLLAKQIQLVIASHVV